MYICTLETTGLNAVGAEGILTYHHDNHSAGIRYKVKHKNHTQQWHERVLAIHGGVTNG